MIFKKKKKLVFSHKKKFKIDFEKKIVTKTPFSLYEVNTKWRKTFSTDFQSEKKSLKKLV